MIFGNICIFSNALKQLEARKNMSKPNEGRGQSYGLVCLKGHGTKVSLGLGGLGPSVSSLLPGFLD